jgi:predicted hydrolase (HD superfamily)
MTFREWWLEMMEGAESATEEQVAEAWQAATDAERERATAIMLKHIHNDNYAKWNEAVKTVMREINEPT